MADLADTTKYYHDRIFVFCIKNAAKKNCSEFVCSYEEKKTNRKKIWTNVKYIKLHIFKTKNISCWYFSLPNSHYECHCFSPVNPFTEKSQKHLHNIHKVQIDERNLQHKKKTPVLSFDGNYLPFEINWTITFNTIID